MQGNLCSMIECSGFHAAWLNAVDFMQHGPKHPDWMQWIPWSIIECRVFHALWRNGSRLYAVESMQCDECMDSRQPGKMHPDWMQWIPCSLIECSGFHAAWLNAVDSMQREEMEPYWMQWILFSMIECSGFHAANWMQCILCSMAQSIPIERSGFHAFWVYEM